MNKTEIRLVFQNHLSALSDLERGTLMQKMGTLVVAHHRFKAADTVALSLSQGFELPTLALVQIAQQLNKRVVVPKVEAKRRMNFHEITTSTQYTKSSFGILEPTDAPIVAAADIDLFIVPGLGFSADGQRVGFGGGYYDRYLAQAAGYKLGVTIQSNYLSQPMWPVELTDIKMDEILILD
ncbi:5-formyltetrahydrofolate cyclo-ligase [Weissella diestrammenae]|uniref:5-formyltetrahydrofolate cyclo-ligase n=1 Tax=Weissella diestrammenae TaxID=1162633 RepID=A0A7G9T3T8_9LACO|nr:5-formyltetrahydrofolate cyclo-ligase [Weissella diestrammenae]MCM0582749.1 5-formyltetrahydrofolate cyclo-ligase [Weissella diestrammenae]QNN74763.1 5-formyltetrahydrofolate cyclo-ligase [Weissella diestrammenae]